MDIIINKGDFEGFIKHNSDSILSIKEDSYNILSTREETCEVT